SSVQARSYVIPNPVTMSNAECVPFEERKKKIVSPGRVEFEQKRQDVLIRAFEQVHEKYPEYELYCYGDGPDLERAKALAAETKAKDAIFFPGAVTPVEEHIKDATLAAFASDFEGIPNTVIEAMNMCVPVVSTDCSPGGARLLLGEDEFGYVVPRGDADKLAEKMIYALGHPEEAREKCEQAKASLARFENSKIANMWRDAVKKIKSSK
ncbi:MAG: glycosyltransferase, partial [Clostridia bacterium]|nr:glycosyltransferase [Clostridia bacterium]